MLSPCKERNWIYQVVKRIGALVEYTPIRVKTNTKLTNFKIKSRIE